MQQIEFFVSLGHFLPFYFPNNLENQNFEVKRVSGDVIILHKWTIDDNHMMYGSWDMKCNKQNVLSSWAIFCLFISITTRKIKILKSEKSIWRCHHFTHLYHKRKSYDVLFLRYEVRQTEFVQQAFLSFWATFCPLISLTTQKIEI